MNTVLIAADFTAVASTLAKWGAARQIRKNTRLRSAHGLSAGRELTAAAAYGGWLWHGVAAGQWPEWVSGAVGGALSLVLLGQIGWFEHARPALAGWLVSAADVTDVWGDPADDPVVELAEAA